MNTIAFCITKIQGPKDLHQFSNGSIFDNFWRVVRFLFPNVLKSFLALGSCLSESGSCIYGVLDGSLSACWLWFSRFFSYA